MWKRLSKPVVRKTYMGFKVYITPKDEISRRIYTSGCYEPLWMNWLREQLRPGMVFVDAGANIGLYSMMASRVVGKSGKVIAIEPSEREYSKLLANVELNDMRNVRCLNVALWDSVGEKQMKIAGGQHCGHNTFAELIPSLSLDSIIDVETIRLDDLELPRVDFLKMDVEGSEVFALKGAIDTIRRCHPVLIVEVADIVLHSIGCDGQQIYDFLRDEGYEFYSFFNEKMRRVWHSEVRLDNVMAKWRNDES